MSGSITAWIEQVKNGEPSGAREIWNRFSRKLIQVADTKLRLSRSRAVDGEDIAIIAFSNFLQNADGFQRLVNRDDLWKILFMLTNRRAVDQLRRDFAKRNGGGDVVGESAFFDLEIQQGLNGLPGNDRAPDIDLIFAEEFDCRLNMLADKRLQEIALYRLSGMTYVEIAEQLQISRRSVERKCFLIRELWLETK